MEVNKIYHNTEINTYTGEGEEVTGYAINCKYGYIELETRNTTINGVVTVQAADVETIEKIYLHFDNLGDYELYMDNVEPYPYIDITTFDNPDELENIKNIIIELLEK